MPAYKFLDRLASLAGLLVVSCWSRHTRGWHGVVAMAVPGEPAHRLACVHQTYREPLCLCIPSETASTSASCSN